MEQLLNLIGLLVSLAVIGGWLAHRARVRRRGSSQVRLIWQVLALSLIVLFLFFAISISDDLHWTAVAAEGEGSRKVLRNLSLRAPATVPVVYLAVLVLTVTLLLAEKNTGFAKPVFRVGSPSPGFWKELSGRSPPLPY